MKLDYHQPSNTHIAFCMAIGRQGIKGFGHTSDSAFERFVEALSNEVKEAPEEELKYWSRRCQAEVSVTNKQRKISELVRTPLSGQIGMAVSAKVAEWLSNEVRNTGCSRNQLVTDLLIKGAKELELRLESDSSDAIIREIEAKSGSGENEWSQRVPADLQARLILLSRRFNVSVAVLSRYLHACEYETATADTLSVPVQRIGRPLGKSVSAQALSRKILH